jgi:tRNA (cmo5U34)-methyltransferase
MKGKDTLFAAGGDGAGTFVFDEKVVRVFPDMISRSVPGYALVVPMTGMLARRYTRDHTRVYDLGCSLGAVTLAMRSAIRARGVRIIATDNSPAMVQKCRELINAQEGGIPVEVVQQDLRETKIKNASVVVLNYTLQFIAPDQREELLARVAHGLCPGGVLILSEKIRCENESEQAMKTAAHEDYKRAKGYSELEIAGKRSALDRVLYPDTEAGHIARLERAGFKRVMRWFQCFNFSSFIAFR